MLLDTITEPSDLRRLTQDELVRLAAEIRQVLVQTVAVTGGHLAPNLGVVELTIALHTVFDSPRDKLLWDVSHQSYVHKMLTGRRDRFATLRRHGGLSGFSDPGESAHDHFHWGHAGTAISAGLGLAHARDLAGEDFHVVAVVGDGALSGGLPFEALNAAGERPTRMIVVLNDNAMSIAPNVGGVARALERWRCVADGGEGAGTPGTVFAELGWQYIGPVDGHDLSALQAALCRARTMSGLVVVHVVTVKGKGVAYAEQHPERFHGCGPFDPQTGEALGARGPTYSEVFGQTLTRLAAADPRIVAITAAMPGGTGLKGFAQQFPDRFFDVGIAEQHAAAFAGGLARQGLRPVFAVYSTFLQRAYDQVIHDIALQRLPVTLALDRSGLVEDGATHHGVFDIPFLRCIPNLILMAPRDENELQHMLATAIRHAGPVAIRYPRSRVRGVDLDPEPHPLPIGRGEVIRLGHDAALVALGPMCAIAEAAAERLTAFGVEVAVVNPRFIKPLDEALLRRMAAKTGLLITMEDGVLTGGFGTAVTEALNGSGLDCWVRHLGLPDRFVGHGAPQVHHERYDLSVEGVVRFVLAAVSERRAAWHPHAAALRHKRAVYA